MDDNRTFKAVDDEDIFADDIWKRCPQIVKDGFYKRTGERLGEEEYDRIWRGIPEYVKQLDARIANSNVTYMLPPYNGGRLMRCVNILKEIAKLTGQDVEIKHLKPFAFEMVRGICKVTLITLWDNLELTYGNGVTELFSELMATADSVTLSVGIDDTLHIKVIVEDAVIVNIEDRC